MKKINIAALFVLLALVLLAVPAMAAETVNPYPGIENFVNTYPKPPSMSWPQFMFDQWDADQFKAEFSQLYGQYFTHQQLDEFYSLLSTQGSDAALAYAKTIFMPTSPAMSEPDSAPQRVADTMLQNVVLPSALTRQQKRAMLKTRGTARFVGGDLRYEMVDTGTNRDGKIPGITAGLAWDKDQFSYGFMIPYDHLDMDGWNAERFGAIAFGRYNQNPAQDLTAGFTASAHYMYLDPDNFDAVNYYGFGLAASINYDRDWIAPGLAFIYQYTKDDTDRADDVQQLVKVALSCGFRVKDNAVFNLYYTYNKDMSSDLTPGTDTVFSDLGFEVGYSVSDAFGLSFGYRKVLGLDNYDSDTIYIGSLYQW